MDTGCDDVYRVIGDRIRTKRKICGLTQEKLAALADIDRSHMGFIEQGRRQPTIATLQKLTRALDLSLEQLFRGL